MDDFCRANLPAIEDSPTFIFELPGLRFSQSLNCAAALLDIAVRERGWGDRIALRTESGSTWTYRMLLDISNRIANMLVHEAGLVAGNRVLLHGTNHPVLAAAWFGVVKAGGVAVTTMPLLLAGELSTIIDRARISHVLCEAAVSTELEAALARARGVDYVRIYETHDACETDRWLHDFPSTFAAC